MIGSFSKVRHIVVGVVIGVTTLLGAVGVIGGGVHPERFDAKTVVVRPDGEGLRITEYVDIDFGTADRHGFERVVANDFGAPTDVTADSPDANDEVSVVDQGSTTRIRIGRADTTYSGQHRYQVEYVLPDAHFDDLGLLADIVAARGDGFPGDDETGRFEVIVTGVELGTTRCDVGATDGVGGCELERAASEPPEYRAVIEPLPEDAGLTVGGDIAAFTEPATIDAPPIPERRSGPNRGLIALGVAALGVVGVLPVYRWARRKGSNEVFAGGAADAAYGSLPAPRADGTVEQPPPVRLVPDEEMDQLVTIEFVPPSGIEPWEGQVLLREKIGDGTVEAWLSGLVGREAITLDENDGNLSIASGPRRAELDPADAALLDPILALEDPYVTGKYDAEFAAAWNTIRNEQQRRIVRSGWWRHMPPGVGLRPGGGSPFGVIVLVVFLLIWAGSLLSAMGGLFRSWPAMVLLALLLPAAIAYVVYRALLPSRSAQGSALTLRTESFRRFLHASEGHHVEWAWSHGTLREYSAWAVALDEADAWSRALADANVPPSAAEATAPILVHRYHSSMSTARTAPSSSGGGRSGGFGGGGVGGGGGGGSSGSW